MSMGREREEREVEGERREERRELSRAWRACIKRDVKSEKRAKGEGAKREWGAVDAKQS